MSCHRWLGQLEEFFGMIKMALCDGLQIGKLESSSDRDVPYPRLDGFAQVIFYPGGSVLARLS